MNVSFYIAKRYLFAKKSRNVINIISAISVAGVMIGTMALIVILSVLNGLNGLMQTFFNTFDPDIRIESAEGKVINTLDPRLVELRKNKSIAVYTDVIEENALVKYNDKQYIATIKGVNENFSSMTGIDTMMSEGEFILSMEDQPVAAMGDLVAYFLSFSVNYVNPITIYAAQRNMKSETNPEDAIRGEMIHPVGVFKVHPEIDLKYVIVPLDFARQLFNFRDEITSLEIKLHPDFKEEDVIEEFEALLGPDFTIKNKYEQRAFLYKTIEAEKLATFFILSFILLVASFNVVGSLTMLILDKKNDINILRSMGANLTTIRRIFLFEGWLISILGALFGLILGFILAYTQQEFGWFKLQGSGSFIIDAYPVKIEWQDFLVIFITVVSIGFLAAWYPVRYITRKHIIENG